MQHRKYSLIPTNSQNQIQPEITQSAGVRQHSANQQYTVAHKIC